MKVKFIYILVVCIWSTTPLAIKWSNESFGFVLSVSLRMALALVICLMLLAIARRKLFVTENAWKVYLAGAFSFFPNMLLVYWSAQFIPSGLLSVLLGIYPFFVGGFSIYFLKENPFNFVRVVALLVAISGLMLINHGQLALDDKASYGVFGILFSSVLFALATVSLKKIGSGLDPLRQLTGSLLFSVPFFVLTWLLVGADVPDWVSLRAAGSVAYLVIAGSILGGLGFFFIIRHCSVSTVALIPLITPVFSMLIGGVLAGEVMNTSSILGSVFILCSLAIYQGVWKHIVNILPKRPAID